MTTQESEIECDVNIHFIVPNHHESENDCGEEMWLAFNKCSELGLQPEWITEKICNKIKPSKNDVFIIEEFKGSIFETLRNFRCSIVSPKCLLTCFTNGEPIPEGKSPIYTTAMRGMCICASGLNPETKDQVQTLVEYMGGFFTKQLRSSVTHLIAESVMSAKYEAATEMKIPIMTKEWIEAVWQTNLKEVIKADDTSFNKYKCPVFMNLVVTSTNLSKRQKEETKHLINDHGGIFMGPLDGNKVKVVLASEKGPLSDKLKYALDNGIACLRPDWVSESIKVGYALPFRDFIIKSVKACSTPEKPNTRQTLNCSEISSIPFEKHHSNYVNESLSSTVSNFSTIDAIPKHLPNSTIINVLDRLTFAEAKLAGPFLDGCNIYLVGFITGVRDKLNRILNVGGATRLDDISDAVTHVIVGDENKAFAELKVMKSRGLWPYVLNIEWLEESMKLKRPAPEDRFLYQMKDGASKKNIETPASPLSKKNLQMLQQPKRPPVPSFQLEKEDVPASREAQTDLVQQYLQETTGYNDTTVQEFGKSQKSISGDNHQNLITPKLTHKSKNSMLENTPITNLQNDTSSVPLSQSCTMNEKLFKDLTFAVTGFDDEENHVQDRIVMLGGRIISKCYSGIPDYGVVPVFGTLLKYTVNEIVTDLYIEDCINQDQIIDIMYYHRPLSIRKACKPLLDCVVTMSVYTGMEREYLSTLATKLGAICQDMFARKANVEKNTCGSTHLVCPTPEGNKYNAAVRWKLPAVTADWLKSCAEQLALVDETPYLVGETMAPNRSSVSIDGRNIMSTESKLGLSEEILKHAVTPKRYHNKDQEVVLTETPPLINKRLSSVTNQPSQSPFHISTPESPYGQVFKPNPSPNTRKDWLKWVNSFPDIQDKEPPLKRRAPSTPFSELKRQLWEKLKNPGHVEKGSTTNKTSITPNKNIITVASTEKEINDQSTEAILLPSCAPINRKLDFDDETSQSNKSNNEINLQIAQLDEVLQRSSNTPEKRYSLSGDNIKKYDVEVPDHIQKCIVKDSQFTDAIVWEDPDHPKRLISDKRSSKSNTTNANIDKYNEPEDNPKCKLRLTQKFMLSGIKDREAYEQAIKHLGGDVSTDQSFDNTATHLLCIRLSRNEKLLGSIASGKWVLHCSYLRDSEREGKFLDEEKYEWGNPKSKDVIPEPNSEIEQQIAAAAYRWRLKLLKDPEGPFSDIVALLLISEEKYDSFKRLIEAGGGAVKQARPPYDASPSGQRITHCFVNVKQVSQPIDWAMLASKGILCFLPQYLSDHLTATIPLNPRDSVLPEFRKYLTLLPK